MSILEDRDIPEEAEPTVADIETLEEYLEEEDYSDEPAGMWVRFFVMLFTILPGSLAGQVVTLSIVATGSLNPMLAVTAGSLAAIVTLAMWVLLFLRGLYHANRYKFIFTTDYEGTRVKPRRIAVEAIRTMVVPARRDVPKPYKRINMRDILRSVNATLRRMAQEQTIITRHLEARGFHVVPASPELTASPDRDLERLVAGPWWRQLAAVARLNLRKVAYALAGCVTAFLAFSTWTWWFPLVLSLPLVLVSLPVWMRLPLLITAAAAGVATPIIIWLVRRRRHG